MLVLTRKQQESIRIGDSITITVLQVKGNSVRLGLEGPDDVTFMRSEVQGLGSIGKAGKIGTRKEGKIAGN